MNTQSTIFKTIFGTLVLFAMMLAPMFGWGQLYTFDDFNYPDNALLTDNGWVAHSGGTTNPISVGVSNGLTYAGYSGSTGITGVIPGNAARLVNTGQDVSKTFGPISTGTIYYTFLVNVTTGTAGYFIHLGSSATAFAARLWVKPSTTTGKINFGISNGSAALYAASPTDFDPGTTYLIIIRYDVTAPNAVSLWVKSSGIPITEATAGTPEFATSGSGLAIVNRICLRQYDATQSMTIDGIRVGPTWADVLPSSVIGTPTKLVVTSINGGSSPTSGVPFSVAVQAQDNAGLSQPVTSDVIVTLSGTGIGGTITGTILNGQNSVTISGVTMSEGYGLTITATQNTGTPTLIAGTSAPFNVTSATPNYRSKTSGTWNTAGTWEIQISGNWYNATDFPNSSNKVVTILNGHTVEVTDNNGTCGNLSIDAGGKLWKSSPTVASYLNVYGNILNNGTIGSSDAGVTPSALGFDIEGTSCLISGSGTFDAWRMAKFTNTIATTNIAIDQDITLRNGVPSTVYNSAASTTLNILINSGKKLAVTSAGINLLNVNLTISSGASLLDNGTITNQTGTNVIVERTITGASQSWHLLSSPVAAQTIDLGFTAIPASDYDFFAWDEPSGTWVNFKNTTVDPTWNTANGSTNFTAGKGYLVEYNETNPTKLFQGILNTGAVSFPLSNSGGTGTYAAYNLAGNPYPSVIDWKALNGWSRGSLVPNSGGYDMSIWNDAVGNYGSFNSAGSSGNNGVTQYIPAAQGFMVKAASAGTLGMDNGIRVHDNQPFLKSTDEISNILRLKVNGNVNTYSDEIVVEFGHQISTGGAEKMFGFYETAPSLYTVKSTGNYSIDFRGEPGAVVIPVSFNAGADGNYSLTASQLESFPSSTVITLEDLKAARTQNLMQNPAYTFTATKNDEGARFLLHFGGAFSVNDKENRKPVSIYASGNSVYISNQSGTMLKGEVIVYNMIGQPVMSQHLSENPLTKINLSGTTGYYLIKVITGNNAYSGKVFINQE